MNKLKESQSPVCTCGLCFESTPYLCSAIFANERSNHTGTVDCTDYNLFNHLGTLQNIDCNAVNHGRT